MSYLAYPPRLPVEFSESIAQLIQLTRKIKNEVAPHKNEFNEALAMRGRAFTNANRPRDAKSSLMRRQMRKTRYWVSFVGEGTWDDLAEMDDADKLKLSDELLHFLEGFFLTIQRGRICPLTKVAALTRTLCRRPIISIRQLADDVLVSESTAKRWLKSLERSGLMSSELKDGQRQFINEGLLAVIEKYV